MPRLVLLAKSTYVWLDQLSRRYRRDIRTLDAIPDEELARLAEEGITGLWLIGLWERSRASARIKQLRGQPDAVASAYSLDDYVIAADLGGSAALEQLRARAGRYGIRLASDMVPNHMGIDSRWVIEHPEWFLSLAEPPFPAYTFNGPDLSDDERVGIRIEDHYYDASDAAVVFERTDRATGGVQLRLPRQRRDSFPVERHGPAGLLEGRRPRGGDPRRSWPLPGSSRSSASMPRWSWPSATSNGCGSPSREPAGRSRREPGRASAGGPSKP